MCYEEGARQRTARPFSSMLLGGLGRCRVNLLVKHCWRLPSEHYLVVGVSAGQDATIRYRSVHF